MYLLYADESGTPGSSRYFVLAGLAVFERQTYFLSRELDSIEARHFPDVSETVEFHSADLFARSSKLQAPFDQLSLDERKQLRDEILTIIAKSKTVLFAVAIEQDAVEEPPYELAIEELVNRFDRMLHRRFRGDDRQRGLVVVADSSYRQNIAALAKRIWREGHRWGQLRNMADGPFFAPARESRLLQLADFCSNAVYRRYEHGDIRQFDAIARRLDRQGRQLHGLVHYTRDRHSCFCPACLTRGLGTQVQEAAPEWPAHETLTDVADEPDEPLPNLTP